MYFTISDTLEDVDCSGYAIDDCKFGPSNIIDESDGIPEEACQAMCKNQHANCTFYIYEKTGRECQFLNMAMDDYVGTCLRYAGPKTSSVTKCLPGMSMFKGSGLRARSDDCKVSKFDI